MNRAWRTLALWTAALAASSGSALWAQNITGSWQGTLAPEGRPPLRIVIKISRADDESLKAVLYSIDQPSPPLNASSISLQGTAVKIGVLAIGGNYEGKLSGDGNSITGTFNQGPVTPLNLARATPETAWAIPDPPPPPKTMAEDADPSFEVATIKPSNPDTPGQSFVVGRGGANLLTTTNTSLNFLIEIAYGVQARQITNGPGWLETEQYDITAKPDQAGIPNVTQVARMVQKLLADRFQLSFHREKKEMSAYTLTVAKTGPKLAKDETGGVLPGFGGRGAFAIGVRNATMTEFAVFLQGRMLDRPVVDQTGLTGRYDFTLQWRPDQLPAGPNVPQLTPEIESRPDLFTAIQEQLGLKLEATKAPVEVLVIDKVQKPSEN